MRFRALAVVAVLVLLFAGCSSSSPAAPPDYARAVAADETVRLAMLQLPDPSGRATRSATAGDIAAQLVARLAPRVSGLANLHPAAYHQALGTDVELDATRVGMLIAAVQNALHAAGARTGRAGRSGLTLVLSIAGPIVHRFDLTCAQWLDGPLGGSGDDASVARICAAVAGRRYADAAGRLSAATGKLTPDALWADFEGFVVDRVRTDARKPDLESGYLIARHPSGVG